MADTILEYDKLNEHLPQSLRAFVGAADRMATQDFNQFYVMYKGVEQLAVFNNRIAAEFASGFTILNYKYLRSGVAPRLLKTFTNKTVGMVYYQTDIEEKVLNEKFEKEYFSKKLKQAVYQSAMTGRSAMVLYGDKEDANKKASIVNYNLFRHRLRFDEHGDVVEAWLYIVKLDGKVAGTDYIVCEHRYYNTNKEPMQKFIVFSAMYNNQNKKDADTRELTDLEISAEIQQKFQDIKFGKEVKLNMNSIGVFNIDYTESNSKFIDSDIPEAMFVDAVDNALTIDTSITDKEVEKEIGRGQVLIPELGAGAIGMGTGYQTQQAVGGNMMRTLEVNYKNPTFQKYPSMRMEDSKPQNVQFDIRSEQWNNQIDNDTARLCANVGISILDYDPRLLMSGQRTDDEINAMTDITANTVQAFRNLNQEKINQLLEAVVDLLDLPMPVAIRWSMASILNPTKNIDLIIKQLQSGLISRKEAIRRANPDLTDNEVEQIYKAVQSEVQAQDINSTFNSF